RASHADPRRGTPARHRGVAGRPRREALRVARRTPAARGMVPRDHGRGPEARMSFFRSVVVIARLTFAEAVRRRIVVATGLCGLAFLVLFAIGFHFVIRGLAHDALKDRLLRTAIITFFALAGLYATNFLTIMTAVLLPIDTLSGEIASGVMQTIASKPVRRSAIVLGKWLAFCVVIAGYLA